MSVFANKFHVVSSLSVLLVACATGCESSDPEPAGNTVTDTNNTVAMCEADKGMTILDNASCQPAATDYKPRENNSKDDSWAACISDDNLYHPFNASVGSNARVLAFEEIKTLLGFGGNKTPTADDFVQAKIAYSQAEGLQSRLARREDTHYPAVVVDGKQTACNKLSADQVLANPDRCVAQAKIQPLIETAFTDGALGKETVLNAARIEAGLLWFLYVSLNKEIETCGSEKKEDCDSVTAYYSGSQVRENPTGFGAYVKARSPQAHDRVWDGLLAMRCWRDLDQALPATNIEMRQQVQAQVDVAALRGLALIVRDRLQNSQSCGVAWETVRVLGPVLNRSAVLIDATKAAAMAAEFAKTDAGSVDVKAATDALDSIYACP